MVEIPKKIGKIMNADPNSTKYINTGVHKKHYWMVDCKKARQLYDKAAAKC